jgi:hypothetical protein
LLAEVSGAQIAEYFAPLEPPMKELPL